MTQAVKPFEFMARRAMTEATGAAACRYDSAEDIDEEELSEGDQGYFDLNTLPDPGPIDLFSQTN